jgi:hypothetical protein
MVFPVIGGDGKPTGYDIDNSLRFNDGDSPKLTKTFGSAGTSVQTFTISFWIKKCLNGKINDICGVTNGLQFQFKADDTLRINFFTPGEDYSDFVTSQLFRDPSAWYHIVLAVDTTQGTEANRKKLYVNGSQVSSFGTQNFPTQNRNLSWNSTAEHQVGYSAQSNNYADIYLSDFNSVDGSALTPSSFGETNDNGVWIPKKYLGSYGDNGFFLEFQGTGTSQNSSGIGADTSGNDNHYAVTNLAATDVTVDTPTNNFCTMNPLISFAGASDGIDAFTEGNTVVDSNNDTSAAGATFGVQNGKWYYEAKLTTGNQSSTNFATGWASTNYEGQKGTGNGVGFMSGEDNIAVDPGGNLNQGGTGSTSVFGNRSTNDIFQVALDLDNGKIHFGVNGTYSNGSATNSTTLDASNPDYSSVFDTAGEFYMPAFAQGSTGQTVLAYNFGNPAFAISSGNADANGYGNFEYAVPSGYYSLCTKNLAEYG